MRLWRTLLNVLILGIALAGVGIAYLVGFAPGLLPAPARKIVQQVPELYDVNTYLLITAVMVAIFGLFAVWWWREQTDLEPLGGSRLIESNRNVPVAGESIQFSSDKTGRMEQKGADSVVSTLREVLIAAYEPSFDSRESAEAFIDRGEWTEDQYAAAFLSTNDALDYPFLHRIVAWLYPVRAREKRVRRALRAVERSASERFSSYEAPSYRRNRVERLFTLFRQRLLGDRE